MTVAIVDKYGELLQTRDFMRLLPPRKRHMQNNREEQPMEGRALPKTEEELLQMKEDELFYEKTKDFRTQLRVKEMIRSRKESIIAKQVGNKDLDPMYPIETTNDLPIKPVNIDRLSKIPLQETLAQVRPSFQRVPMKHINNKQV